MDESFFQTLRQIQKKERTNASLARVGADFYKQVHSYINKLKRSVGNDPFSDEHYLLKDSQRIATEICERREHKITDAAVMNIHRSYHLFSKDKPEFDLLDTTPLNLTDEEETLYFSLIDTLKEHRLKISLDKFADKEEDSFARNRQTIANPFNETVSSMDVEEDNKFLDNRIGNDLEFKEYIDKKDKSQQSDDILDKLNEIKNAKIVDDEKHESIEAQIAKQRISDNLSNVESSVSSNFEGSVVKSSVGSEHNFEMESSKKLNRELTKRENDSKFPDVNQLYNQDNQFIDLDILDNKYEEEYFNQINNEPNPFEVDDLIKSHKITEKIAILMFKEVGPIVGVDEKIYGPFHPQDLVILPKINAKIFLKNNKARIVDI